MYKKKLIEKINDAYDNPLVSYYRMLASPAASNGLLDINCRDPLGRSALLMAIDNENLEMVELMLDNKVITEQFRVK